MTSRKDENSRLVYSTDQGRICPRCGRPQSECSCRRKKTTPIGDGVVRVARETKGRKGKGMTLITGLSLAPAELKTLARQLKQKCGTGGTVKNGVIEIQGDHRDLLMTELKKQGWKVKRSGG